MRKRTTISRFIFVLGLILTLGYLSKFIFSSTISLFSSSSSFSRSEAMAQAPASQKTAAVEQTSGGAPQKGPWAASATGRVEPKEGEIRIISQASGEISEVIVKSGDRVQKGDLLVRLEDSDLQAKLTAALAEEAVRILERNEETVKDLALDRRKAEDAVARTNRLLFKTQLALDEVARKVRVGDGNADDLSAARTKVADVQKKLSQEQSNLEKISSAEDLPLSSRLESSLSQARSDVLQIENAIERTRIRAPADGTVLNVWAKAGEIAISSPDAQIVLLGDLTGMRVRTEVEEIDVVKVDVGQKAVVRSDAYPGLDFLGSVTTKAPALGSQRITSRGPRRPNDIEVLEVMVVLDGTVLRDGIPINVNAREGMAPSLLTGMRVDVFFCRYPSCKDESTS